MNTSTLVYKNRALNAAIASYSGNFKEVNPYLIFKFDVRQINDIVTFRVGKDRSTHWIVAGCNDGYLKVFCP